MNCLRRCSALSWLLAGGVLLFSSVRAEDRPPEKKANAKLAPNWLIDRALTISPAPAPVPALKYRLYPRYSDRKDGNAVPIYSRFAHERGDAWKKQLQEKPREWNKLPLAKLPMKEVKEFLDDPNNRYNLKQLDIGRGGKPWIGITLWMPAIPSACECLTLRKCVCKRRFWC